ncbi:unnamed protein product [Anisakis simplex]|uniref:Histone deacetylase 10 (inferred by orthology to a human protein) n=1 Tax=Anisakis simplex TaxID=6269 RepID=A0A0M3KFH4_ANISI|nr:unnamed protein product [Anisakis simplex]
MNANSSNGERSVFFVSDSSMLKHKCEWDDEHIEVPQRLENILTNLKDNVLKECETIKAVAATIDDIRLVHDEAYIESLEKTTQMNIQQLESYCSGFEDVYANNFTYDACLMSAGCAIEAMKSVINERHRFSFIFCFSKNTNRIFKAGRLNECVYIFSSAFAAVRPPGHHASKNNACGFCFFNNVAICALKARQLGVERVLIVDWDVHAGQGTQYSIKSDPNIKLISIHRFENGHFWPNLPENSIQHDC